MNGAMNFRSRLVPLPMNNVDTDQIIPARFLKTISKQGLDKQLFNDWRYDAQAATGRRHHPAARRSIRFRRLPQPPASSARLPVRQTSMTDITAEAEFIRCQNLPRSVP